MKKIYLVLAALFQVTILFAQGNILSTNATAEQIMVGQYDPNNYKASVVLTHPDSITQGINARISTDSLLSYLQVLRSFGNRNTGSDTNSATFGIGAARRWVYSKFQQFSTQNENRLVSSYLQFDYFICNKAQHRNVFAVLPGADTTDKSIVIVEAHIDSRCEGGCDTTCLAEGMEDNGSGTALVMELARVMSQYTYNHSIVFLITIGEEQGLFGADAFADYCKQKGIEVKAVLNNDVVGGIICGNTASPPGCMTANSIDSTNVRLFSFGGFNSAHKQLARFIKLEYKEQLQPVVSVPMTLNIMTPEDRSGRGGDHIPFRQQGYTAMRFCAANENGNADVSSPSYSDRQHTSSDILGVDTDNDTFIDSFFVDFNYLARNASINGNTAAMIAIGPKTPNFILSPLFGNNTLSVTITSQTQYNTYRLAIRTTTNDWDSVYTFSGLNYNVSLPAGNNYIASVAAVLPNGVESLFSEEKLASVHVSEIEEQHKGITLLQNHPNPFDGETVISVWNEESIKAKDAYISICDITGKEIRKLKLNLTKGMNEVTYYHGYNASGTFIYTLFVDGRPIESKRMIFAN